MRITEVIDKSTSQYVTRIDSKPITDFASNLKPYKHTDDWSQSGIDNGDDSYWKKNNLKVKTTKGLFAGEPNRTALYATGNAHQTRYVEFTQDGQPIVYFDKKDIPVFRKRKTYLTVFDAKNFKKLPTGEYFSKNPGDPISQEEITDPFGYITKHGWIIRVTDDLVKVLKQVKKMHKQGKISFYGAEGMELVESNEQDYMKGHCHVLALALLQLHPDWQLKAHIGWEEEAENDDDYRIDHVYIVAPDGSAYDCRGKFASEQELVGPNETGIETQFVDYTSDDIQADVARGELKKFTKQDVENAIKFLKQ